MARQVWNPTALLLCFALTSSPLQCPVSVPQNTPRFRTERFAEREMQNSRPQSTERGAPPAVATPPQAPQLGRGWSTPTPSADQTPRVAQATDTSQGGGPDEHVESASPVPESGTPRSFEETKASDTHVYEDSLDDTGNASTTMGSPAPANASQPRIAKLGEDRSTASERDGSDRDQGSPRQEDVITEEDGWQNLSEVSSASSTDSHWSARTEDIEKDIDRSDFGRTMIHYDKKDVPWSELVPPLKHLQKKDRTESPADMKAITERKESPEPNEPLQVQRSLGILWSSEGRRCERD